MPRKILIALLILMIFLVLELAELLMGCLVAGIYGIATLKALVIGKKKEIIIMGLRQEEIITELPGQNLFLEVLPLYLDLILCALQLRSVYIQLMCLKTKKSLQPEMIFFQLVIRLLIILMASFIYIIVILNPDTFLEILMEILKQDQSWFGMMKSVIMELTTTAIH